ncbi:pectate lyase [Streptomyces sp. DSM 118148]|uniref:pectate lyase n=1 Tax=Streptomyces sp. DSM 118148 TaxID=3448667 RepID=UPI00403FFE70
MTRTGGIEPAAGRRPVPPGRPVYVVGAETAVHSRMGAQMLVENNVFRGTQVAVTTSRDSDVDGYANLRGNDLGGAATEISRTGVSGGGAKEAGDGDKVFQFNGAGTLNLSDFAMQNLGTFARSCGSCRTQYKRTINLDSIEATYKGGKLVGINTNYGDSATLKNVTIVGDSGKKIVPCQKYIGNNTGKEPSTNGSGADGAYCKYSSSDITYK